MMRALRSDRMTYAVQGFIEEKLGSKFVGGTNVEFAKSFEESGTLKLISIRIQIMLAKRKDHCYQLRCNCYQF